MNTNPDIRKSLVLISPMCVSRDLKSGSEFPLHTHIHTHTFYQCEALRLAQKITGLKYLHATL